MACKSAEHKWLRKIIYVIANEVKQSKALAIASFRFAPLAMTNVYLILHNYLEKPPGMGGSKVRAIAISAMIFSNRE
ncbi:hypothetical protein LC653_33350 [Nostoc sp. CHAB 5784]|uniref:hypothetical protein n=1 Tax=Nostoc mirabile TaxID=2907820 RepID=UPI001E2A12E9|nr:hypothetical protein [Nostoc mirabile]MCC5668608.1 hypothetical protein [Nostoc mirabile CHAB5784]